MIFEFGKYKLDIDVEKTRAFYRRAGRITDGCTCQGCRNYEQWVGSSCVEPKHVLEQMGVAMEKACEVYVNCPNEDGSVFYGGFYHLCGRILQEAVVWHEVSEGHAALREMSFVELGGGYQVAFTDEVVLLEDDFPVPAIQMEVMANIPWVLEEPFACD